MKRLVLVDGNALLHRAYHATPPLTTSQGELINAVFGFTSMLLRSFHELYPDFIVVTWDEKAPTFRHQEYTQYKATRGPTDDGLSSQYKRVHEVVKALNIPEFSLAGYEADDLIGTLARQAIEEEKNLEVIVVTGDRDIMQIIEKRVKILMPKKTLADVGLYGVDEFFDKFGFEPKFLVDYKALAGDASDNIPGVAGIGDITAKKLVAEFKTVENIYQELARQSSSSAKAEHKSNNLSTFPERMQRLLAEGAESAALSKRLATLDLNAPIKLDLEKCVLKDYDKNKAIKLFEELEFRSLIPRLPGVDDKDTKKAEGNIEKAVLNLQSENIVELDLKVKKVLEKMSSNGIMVDLKFLNDLSDKLKKRLKELEEGIYKEVGHEFNINSPKQLAEILFDELHLPVVKKTKTGRSTDESTLQELKSAHPVIELLLEYRLLFKLISTYLDALPKYADENSRIHSTFNVEGAATGRLSSTNPNLQNIPIRGDLGFEVRKAFTAPQGRILLGADYSQIELRIMAHLSGDEALIKAFQDNVDIHKATASKIFKIPLAEINKDQRMVGKTMNFATLYGQGPHALSQQLGVEYAIARQYIQEYFEEFPKVKEWMGKTLEAGYKNGFVQTIWGRKRFIPELASPNRMVKAAGERAAINHPIQGTQADMIKKAMIEIDEELNKDALMVLQIHDELLFEIAEKDLDTTSKIICQKMEGSLSLSVPVLVELKSGKNWGDMVPLKKSA
jgi:DNA polymerase I